MRAKCKYNGVYRMSSSSLNRQYVSASRQRGISLIELMIGLTVGALILAGALTVFAKISFSGLENTRAMRLNQQMRATMDFIRRDLQRSGYVNSFTPALWNLQDGDGNYTGRAAMVTVIDLFGAVTINGNCIAYSYDRDENGAQAGNEQFGFELNAGAVRSGTSVVNCNGDGVWQDISGDEITITQLTFTQSAADSFIYEVDGDEVDADGDGFAECDATETCLDRRKIDVVMVGQLATDAAVTVTLREEVKLKNDRYFIAP